MPLALTFHCFPYSRLLRTQVVSLYADVTDRPEIPRQGSCNIQAFNQEQANVDLSLASGPTPFCSLGRDAWSDVGQTSHLVQRGYKARPDPDGTLGIQNVER